MGLCHPPQPVCLIVGMLSRTQTIFPLAEERMTRLWGPIDLAGPLLPFDFTDYYAKQMGAPLLRRFVSFAQLIDPADLATIKLLANTLEAELARHPAALSLAVPRPINLDPGYVDPSKLVLASTKDYSHRVCLGHAVYAEATLRFHRGRWEPFPYTYPDYASGRYNDFLCRVRERLLENRPSPKPST